MEKISGSDTAINTESSNIITDFKINIIAFALISAAVFIMFFPLLKGEVIATNDVGTNDLLYFSLPIRAIYGEALKSGEILQWTPYIFSGFPVFAEGQNGFIYPVNVVTCYLMNPFQAMNWFIMIHSILLGFGVYLFLKKITASGWNSIAMGVAAALCGSFTTGHTRHLNILSVISLMPFLFLFIESYVRKFRLSSVLLSGSVLGLMLLSNHPQFSFICGFFAFLYLFARLHFAYRDKNENVNNNDIKYYFKKAGLFLLVSIVVSVAIGYIQLRETLQLSAFSLRTQDNLTSEYLGMGSFPLDGLLTFVYPYFNGNAGNNSYQSKDVFLFWEYFHYISVPLLLLGIYAAVKNFKSSYVKIFIIIGVISLALAMGEHLKLYKIFSVLPFVKSFRFPVRWLFGMEMSLIFLSGFGVKHILGSITGKTINSKSKGKGKQIIQKSDGQLKTLFKEKPYLPGLILSAVVFLDIFLITGKGVSTADPGVFFPDDNKNITTLIKNDFGRYYTIGDYELCSKVFSMSKGWEGSKNLYKIISVMLPPNQSAFYHIQNVGGYTNLCPNYIYEVWGDADHQGIIRKTASPSKDGKSIVPLPAFLKIMQMWGVKDFKSIFNFPEPFILNFDTLGIKHYLVPDALPRAWIVKDIISTTSDNKNAAEMLLDNNFSPLEKVIVNGVPPQIPEGSENSSADVYFSGNHTLKIKASKPGLVIISDSWYPDWKAKVNGQETPVYRVNNSMRGIISPSADSDIEMYFDKGNLFLFMLISYTLMGGIFVFGIKGLFKRSI